MQQMFKKINDRDDLNNIPLPFATILPDLVLSNISLRTDSEKWDTLRFEVEANNQRIRIKEFFMDWFYPSFPKSLLKTFSLPYEPLSIRSITVNGITYPVFFGMDYSGAIAASTWISGTTLEIRSMPDSGQNFIDMTMNILSQLQIGKFPERKDFISRSYYAGKKRKYSWFEEERIGRMSWGSSENSLCGNFFKKFNCISSGTFNGIHKIKVFTSEDMRGEIWIDLFKIVASLKNGFYHFDEDNMGILQEHHGKDQFRIFSVSNFGPWLLRKVYPDIIATVGASSGIQIDDIVSLIEDIEINRDQVITL
jgi:hypothetical protein